MKYYRNTTQVANALFDIHLRSLTEKELKVLLIIIRQTVGWIDQHGFRKERDWISRSFFIAKTGLSGKSISSAIDSLVLNNFIEATTIDKVQLNTTQERRGKKRIYYKCSNQLLQNLPL